MNSYLKVQFIQNGGFNLFITPDGDCGGRFLIFHLYSAVFMLVYELIAHVNMILSTVTIFAKNMVLMLTV